MLPKESNQLVGKKLISFWHLINNFTLLFNKMILNKTLTWYLVGQFHLPTFSSKHPSQRMVNCFDKVIDIWLYFESETNCLFPFAYLIFLLLFVSCLVYSFFWFSLEDSWTFLTNISSYWFLSFVPHKLLSFLRGILK